MVLVYIKFTWCIVLCYLKCFLLTVIYFFSNKKYTDEIQIFSSFEVLCRTEISVFIYFYCNISDQV